MTRTTMGIRRGVLTAILLLAFGPAVRVAWAGGIDCNDNGIDDNCDIDCGPPGEACDVPGCGMSEDCNENGVPDECDELRWQQVAKLLADDGAADDSFGRSVSVSGDVALIGAFLDDDNGAESGAAYVFRWNGATWTQEQKLLPDDGAAYDLFGNSVSVSGDVAVIGARADSDNGGYSGSAYVFRWTGTTWEQEQKLLADDGAILDQFGHHVSISGDVVVIGVDKDDDNGSNSGSAYVFRWNGATWIQEQKLLPDDGAAEDRFGYSVAVSGNATLIGVYRDDDNGSSSGSAYVYRWNGAIWTQEQKLLADDGAANDLFGNSVSVSDNTAVVGAFGDDDEGQTSGSAYVFRFNGAMWVQEQKLTTYELMSGDRFGFSVSVSGERAVIGANGDDDNGTDSGSAYVYRWNGGHWIKEQTLRPDDGSAFDHFGDSVSVSGERTVIGASGDDDNGSDSDSAYVFDFADHDCNFNGNLDECDISGGTSQDANQNGLPDECDLCVFDADCDDGLFCNGEETCEPMDGCQAGTPLACDDGVGCTVDSCDTTNDVCVNTPNDGLCDNSLFCVPESCDAILGCQLVDNPCVALGLPCIEFSDGCLCNDDAECDDGIGCTDDSCVGTPFSICLNMPNDADCDDGIFCNGSESCELIDGCQAGTLPCGPDEVCVEETERCEIDCDGNSIPDGCDLDCGPLGGACDVPGCGMSEDCNGDGVLDECEELEWQQVEKLFVLEGATDDEFGYSVSVSGDVAVIGVPSDADNGMHSGSAYVFRRNGAHWVQEQKLLPDDGAVGDGFAHSVAVCGDLAVVGSSGNDDNGQNSGSTYMFRWNGATWVQEQKILPDDGAAFDHFGNPVSVSGDVVVIGARSDDDNGTDSGSAYVFRWDGASWVQEQKLLPNDGAANDWFGFSVSVSGDVSVIGGILDDDNGTNSGSTYVFRWNGATWVQEQKLLPDDGAAHDQFGFSASVSGDVAVVGAVLHGDNGMYSGSSYVFRWSGATWVQEQKLLADDGAPDDWFGFSASVSGDLAVIGAPLDDDNGLDSGSVYVFRWNGVSWVQEFKLLSDDAFANDKFGRSVSISGNVAVIGAPFDAGNGLSSGSAYVFNIGGPDCNGNGIPDECDIADGTSLDENGNDIPDECEPDPIPGDCDGDGDVDLFDYACFVNCVSGAGGGVAPGCEAFDFDVDDDIDLLDWRYLQIAFGGAP